METSMANDVETTKKPKHVLIHIEQKNGESVDVRLPFVLMRTGLTLNSVLPKGSAHSVATAGLDLSMLRELSEDDLIQALRDGSICVTTSKGERVSLSCD
jgi:hypothetical protein